MTVEAAIDDSTLRAASAALVTAFEDDPLLGRVFPGNRDRVALLRSAVRATVRMARRRGRIDVYRQPDGEVAGAAVWLPDDASGSVPALGLAVRLGAEVLVRWPSAVPDLARHRLRLRTIHRRLGPHRYLALIGVRADHRRRGIGAKLLEAGLAHCERAGLRAVLDTSSASNAEWYARHRFAVVKVLKWRFGETWVMQSEAARGAVQ